MATWNWVRLGGAVVWLASFWLAVSVSGSGIDAAPVLFVAFIGILALASGMGALAAAQHGWRRSLAVVGFIVVLLLTAWTLRSLVRVWEQEYLGW
jgi:hypothetical protein